MPARGFPYFSLTRPSGTYSSTNPLESHVHPKGHSYRNLLTTHKSAGYADQVLHQRDIDVRHAQRFCRTHARIGSSSKLLYCKNGSCRSRRAIHRGMPFFAMTNGIDSRGYVVVGILVMAIVDPAAS